MATSCLACPKGAGNDAFHAAARRLGVRSITGSERDVLQRLIQCGEVAGGTDVFRVTTESPFTYWEAIPDVWRAHVERGNDVTVIDGVPEGAHFEIYTLESLQRSHARGDERHRSELCSLYVREHRDEFKLEVRPVPASLERLDLRLTVDYPEDLILCREVYAHLADCAPRLPLDRIIAFLDSRADLTNLVRAYVVPARLY